MQTLTIFHEVERHMQIALTAMVIEEEEVNKESSMHPKEIYIVLGAICRDTKMRGTLLSIGSYTEGA